ncbi:MAG TPA: filamentous hemagglutinin N-terminal domain-containing protein [Coleofasciculaceae cyanobacterium]
MKLPNSLFVGVWLVLLMPDLVMAQIVPDTTLGQESTRVRSNVEIHGRKGDRIEGGAIRGATLFQSFQEFNVGEGQRVYFANPVGVQTIFSRVTGRNVSEIRGTLGVDGGANLFLINPNGIIFGQNASLDISGSFIGSTANALRFTNGGEFSATDPQAAPLLTVNVPIGLQYGALGSSIISTGSLSVGQDLTLAADILQVQGQLQAGRDLMLRSPHPIQGQNIRLISGRDFGMGDYRGSSLQINAGRNISYGTVVVDAIDPTVNPTHPAVVLRSGGQIIGTGNLSTTAPSGGLQVDFLSQRDMNIRGITTQGGAIHLTSVNGGITTNGVTLDTTNGARDGGAIALEAFGNIAVGNLNSSSFSISEAGRDTEDTGNGGAIALTTSGNIHTGDLNSSSSSESFSDTGNSGNTGNTGNGGAIALRVSGNIHTRNLNSSSFSRSESYSSSISGDSGNSSNTGNGGAVTLTASQNIRTGALNSYSSSESYSSSISGDSGNSSNTGDSGNGGAITLTTSQNIRTGALSSNSSSSSFSSPRLQGDDPGNSSSTGNTGDSGNGGAIILTAFGNIDAITLDSSSFSDSGNGGNGGAITLTASGDINVSGISFIPSTSVNFSTTQTLDSSSSSDSGNGGNGGAITLTASNNISTRDLTSHSSSNSGNSRDGGTISLTASGNINTDVLASHSSSNSGNSRDGGTISLTASGSIRTYDLQSYSFSSSPSNSTGTGGEITLLASNIIELNSVNSTGYMGGGDITITTAVPFSLNNSVMTTDTFGSGRGGNIHITAPAISFLNGAQASASTHNQGQAGTIVLKAGTVALNGNSSRNLPPGGLFQADNSGIARIPPGTFLGGYVPSGDASDLNQQPRGTLYPSGVFTQTTRGSTGNAGNIRIETGQLAIRNGAAIAVSTFGRGGGGDIDIRANSVLMDRGTLTASTVSGSGGNLTLQNIDLLLMQNNSLISAQARNSANGGNVTINAPDGVIAAVPAEDNDIIASANRGNGGRIDIAIASITGLQSVPTRTPLSDITASSDLGLDGVVEINPLTTDPSQGVLALPTTITDASTQIAQTCLAGRNPSAQKSGFMITGRGGLPPSPSDLGGSEDGISNWASLDVETEGSDRPLTVHIAPRSPTITPIIEAQGWVTDAQGKVMLSAEVPPSTPANAALISPKCP